MTILPLTYLGNREYFSLLLRGDCVIDLHEHYVKQTFRNRCEIMTAGGTTPLTVNVVKGGSGIKRAVRDMRIDYSKRWQHQHWMSIVSAYSGSPYFDHYAELFQPFFTNKFIFLCDLNTGLLETMMKILGDPVPLLFSESYLEAQNGDRDMRGCCKASAVYAPDKLLPSYEQVFSDRLPFQANLSLIDLIFCEGPHTKSFL